MTTSRLTTTSFAVAATILALVGEARGQECPRASSPEEARTLAGETFGRGQQLFEGGDPQGALGWFRCSYGLVPHHNTLYNMGECARALGRDDDAIRYFRTYVETYPQGDDAAEVEARLEELEARRAASDAAAEPAPPPPVEEVRSEPTSRMTLARRLAWVTLGVGGGLAIIGGGLYGGAVARNGDFESTNQQYLDDDGRLSAEERSELEDLRSGGEGLEAGGWALMGIGLASIAASLVLFFAFDATETAPGASSRAPALSLGPLVLDEGGGISASGTF